MASWVFFSITILALTYQGALGFLCYQCEYPNSGPNGVDMFECLDSNDNMYQVDTANTTNIDDTEIESCVEVKQALENLNASEITYTYYRFGGKSISVAFQSGIVFGRSIGAIFPQDFDDADDSIDIEGCLEFEFPVTQQRIGLDMVDVQQSLYINMCASDLCNYENPCSASYDATTKGTTDSKTTDNETSGITSDSTDNPVDGPEDGSSDDSASAEVAVDLNIIINISNEA